MSIKKVALLSIPVVVVSMFAFFIFRKKESIQVDTLKKKAYQIGSEVRWTAGNLKIGKVYEVSLLKDSNVIKTVQSKFTAVSNIMTGSFIISGISPDQYKLALVSDNKILDAADLIVMPITPIPPPGPPPQPPPSPPPPSPPPQPLYDIFLQVKRGVSFELRFYYWHRFEQCNLDSSKRVSHTIVKKESGTIYDFYSIKINIPSSGKPTGDDAIMEVITDGRVSSTYPLNKPPICTS